jgi:hypothetical protein
VPRSRPPAIQWSGAALVLALLFASLGLWGFDGAWSLASLFAVVGIYLYLTGRRRKLPDPALMLARAQDLAAEGRIAEARGLLAETVRLSPWFAEAREFLEKLS